MLVEDALEGERRGGAAREVAAEDGERVEDAEGELKDPPDTLRPWATSLAGEGIS